MERIAIENPIRQPLSLMRCNEVLLAIVAPLDDVHEDFFKFVLLAAKTSHGHVAVGQDVAQELRFSGSTMMVSASFWLMPSRALQT